MFQGITVNNHQQQCFHAAYDSKRRVLLHAAHKFLMNIDVNKITLAEICFCQTGLNCGLNRFWQKLANPVQKRTIRIIFPFTHGLSYSYTLFAANQISLNSRRHDLSKSFSKTFASHLPAFTTSSHIHATPLFYPGLDQPRLSHA